MAKKIVFVIGFALVIIGLIKLHYCSVDEKSNMQTAAIGQSGLLYYPASLENRVDIPFELLIDPEFRELLPSDIDYEGLRPQVILLKKSFDYNDPAQLGEFPNITVNGLLADVDIVGFTPEQIDIIKNNMRESVLNGLSSTSYKITDEKPVDVSTTGKQYLFKYQYRQASDNGKNMNVITSYIWDGKNQVSAILSSPDKNLKEWQVIYNNLLNSIEFR